MALAEARAPDRRSSAVGYAACYWCDVTGHESCEDEGMAALMNRPFVDVRVGYEKQPDIEELPMTASPSANKAARRGRCA